jgi:hypothetical protein
VKTKNGNEVDGIIKQQGVGCDICGTPVVFIVDGIEVPATIRIAGEEFEAMHDVHCDTCGKPLRLCDDCWNGCDDCNECYERREKEQWCPLCDQVCVNMTPDEKKQHMEAHRAEMKAGRR